jgi:putative ABC transport system permease protein
MNKYLWKNTLRDIRFLKSRFIALFLIIALSAGFFIGFGEIDPLMRNTADDYFKKTHLADFRLLSDFGITDDDLAAIRSRPEVSAVMASYDVDVIGTKNDNASESYIYSIHSLPVDLSDNNKDYLSRVTVIKGRMPQAADECLISDLANTKHDNKIGDVISINDDNDEMIMSRLVNREYTVVGIAKSPQYISVDLGNTNVGDGLLDDFLYLPNEAFKSEVYTAVYITLKSTEGMSAFSEEYKKAIEDERLALEAFGEERSNARYDDIVREAEGALADGKKEYSDGKAEAEKGLSGARKLIDENTGLLIAGKAEYAAKEKEYIAGMKKLNEGERELKAGAKKLNKGKAIFKKKEAELNAGKAKLKKGKAKLKESKEALADAKAEYKEKYELYEERLAEMGGYHTYLLLVMRNQLADARKKIAKAEKDIAKGEKDLAKGAKKVAKGEKALSKSRKALAKGEKALAKGKRELADGQKELAAGKILLDEAKAKIKDGEKQLSAGKKEYATQKKEIGAKLADAEKQIEDGQKTIDRLARPEWYVFDRTDNSEYTGFADAAGKMKALAVTLPIVMYLIAALICITAIMRMIEEDRLQIGTLKALGYRKIHILIRYLVYSSSVGILGGAVGVLAGMQIFPQAIWKVYAALYTLGDVQLVYSPIPVLIGIFGGTIVITATALFTCLRGLNCSASMLMRPKAPPAGKRVLIERIGPIWGRLSFSGKVTARNAFRYKRRFIAAIIGVAGCMGFLITGFGLSDSIKDVIDLQYGRVMHSEITVILSKPGSEDEASDINKKMDRYGEYAYAYDITITASKGDIEASDTITALYVPESPERLSKFITLQNRRSESPVAFPPKAEAAMPSVVVTEKLAETLGVDTDDIKSGGANSTISFGVANERRVDAQMSGITENYFNNYVYITPGDYQKLYGTPPEYNTVMLKTGEMSHDKQKALLDDLINTDGVLSAYSTQQARDTIDNMLNSFGSVIWIIVLVAAFLAIIVLYSLANINVRERTRELATLDVLGFYRKEVYSYILQENMLLTALGILIGVPAGILLHRYVIATIEGADVMLGQDVAPFSILLSGGFTFITMIVVNLLMIPTINRINPAISLKSIQ